jgi:hypothetical protein
MTITRYYPGFNLEYINRTHNSQCPSQDLNCIPPEYIIATIQFESTCLILNRKVMK